MNTDSKTRLSVALGTHCTVQEWLSIDVEEVEQHSKRVLDLITCISNFHPWGLFTVSTNIMLSSLLPRIFWLLCFSFILLYYLHFMLVKMIPIFPIGIKLNKISPSTNRLVKVTINAYTNTMQTFKTAQIGALGFYNWVNGVKMRTWENADEKKEKHLTWYESP